MTTLLTESDMNFLHSCLVHLRKFKEVVLQVPPAISIGTEVLNDNIDWLENFINDQPIVRLREQLRTVSRAYEDAITKYDALQRDFTLAKAGIDNLKHLQKYEGMQKIESDELGHKAEVALLKEKIAELTAELAKRSGP